MICLVIRAKVQKNLSQATVLLLSDSSSGISLGRTFTLNFRRDVQGRSDSIWFANWTDRLYILQKDRQIYRYLFESHPFLPSYHTTIHPSIRPSVPPSIHPSIRLPACQTVCLFIHTTKLFLHNIFCDLGFLILLNIHRCPCLPFRSS